MGVCVYKTGVCDKDCNIEETKIKRGGCVNDKDCAIVESYRVAARVSGVAVPSVAQH
jgi:hypothetical protein